MTRQDFLAQNWTPYPPADLNAIHKGRILEIKDTSILLQPPASKNLKLNDPTWVPCSQLKEMAPISVLCEGDVVSVDSLGIVTLLTPKIGTPSSVMRDAQKNISHLKTWSQFKKQIRDFFEYHEFLEVDTPNLVICPGSEPTLDVFSTELKVGSRTQKLFLPTSPEWHLKKALAADLSKIYEIKSCFRNGEITERHQPEFTLLEWYRAYANLNHIKQDACNLIQKLCLHFGVQQPRRVESYSVAQLFKQYLNFDLTPHTTEAELQTLAKQVGVDLTPAESIDDCFFLLFMEKIENKWDHEDLVFVEKYPPYQAALARLTPDGWGDRFEIYWKGYELANAFHELNDPQIQRQRFEEDLAKKSALGKEMIGTDEEFFKALEHGLPPSGGIALGVERLYMAMFDSRDIRELKLFPYK